MPIFQACDNCIISNRHASFNGTALATATSNGFEITFFSKETSCLSYANQGTGILATNTNNLISRNQVKINTNGSVSLTSNVNLVTRNYVSNNPMFQINQSGGNIGLIELASSGTNPNANF